LAQVAPEQPPDDDSIPNEARLLRRVSKTIGVYRNENGSAARVSSGAFKTRNRDEGLSVYVESKLAEIGLTALDVLTGVEGQFFLVAIPAGLVRAQGNGIVMERDPLDVRLGEAHALITGKRPERVLNALAANCEHIVWE
jgi:hypothetical protein